ncbi:hypothetical protein NIES4103_15600 [Nostoc sp. NIES-4103]|nr:hypothetical protein NIES4103_15600 [Nostoc sp. NIES-4103]
MNISLKSLLQNFPNQLLPLLLSLLNDAFLLGLSHLGLHFQWLKWLSLVILYCTFLYWSVQLLRYISKPEV